MLQFSFIIPTFNSGKFITKCLRSIEKQDFPRKNFEIIIADGGSTDNTVTKIKKFTKNLSIKIVKNPKVDAESGKYLGIRKSKGKIIVLLDSDNEIVRSDWLKSAKIIFDKHKDIWGLESPWIVNRKDPLINQYFAMMKMTDPVARLFRPTKEETKDMGAYEIVKVSATDTPVTGANGFFWKKNMVTENINDSKKFEETNYVAYLVMKGNVKFARLKDSGVYHYYCDSLGGFIKKRKKIAGKFLTRKSKKQKTWIDRVGKEKFVLSVLYNVSIIGPLFESIFQSVRTRNIAWIYHPVACFITVTTYTYYFASNKIRNL